MSEEINPRKFLRREFLQGAAALGGAALLRPAGWAAPPDRPIKTVYLVFKCHLDIGFTGTQTDVFLSYYKRFFPEAMDRADALRAAGGTERYVWTVGSWLMTQYLAQATPAEQARAAQAIAAGDLAWHGLPFNWETEMVDPSLIEAGLGLSQVLDHRFGTRTTGAKLTDVPGQTRGLVGPLAKAGIKLLDIGVNPASTPPDVPALFRWRNPAGAEVITLYHRSDYGGIVAVPGGDIAVSVNVRGDNSGVHSAAEIQAIYAELAAKFPGARLIAADLNRVAAALEPFRASLPVVTQEIGDTWVYGCASDPVKIGEYRELSRLRREWVASGRLTAGGPEDHAFISWLLLAPEHTWGCDIKSKMGDWGIYTPAELRAARDQPNVRLVESTWAEKRANNRAAVDTLPPALAAEARHRLAGLRPASPVMRGLARLTAAEEVKTPHFLMALDPDTGAICRLKDRKTGREWASAAHPLALFSYQTFSQSDYDRFLKQYITLKDWWPPQDFGKPGLSKYPAQSRLWHPARQESFAGRDTAGYRIETELHMPPAGDAAGLVAWPERLTLSLRLPDAAPEVHWQLQWFGKTANRLPEAMWLSFMPIAPDGGGWHLDKSGSEIAPQDVVRDGGRSMHAVSESVSYRDTASRFRLETLDAPVVAPGQRRLLNFDDKVPDMAGGIHVSLFNNTWGTNYVQWLNDDLRFRFVLRVS